MGPTWNPRYVAYAREQGRTPRAQACHDLNNFEFTQWVRRKREAVLVDGQPCRDFRDLIGGSTRFGGLEYHAMIDAILGVVEEDRNVPYDFEGYDAEWRALRER